MIVNHLFAKISIDPSHNQLISLIAVAYTRYDDNPEAFIRKVYTHIQTFKLEVTTVTKYSRASQVDTARQDNNSFTFQGIDLSKYADDRGMIGIPNNIFTEFRRTKPKLIEEVIAHNREIRGDKDNQRNANKRRGKPSKAEREIKKLKAQIEELRGGIPDPAQDNGSRVEERDDTPETGTKKKGD